MTKKPLLKTNREFLQNLFSENIVPVLVFNKKQKRQIKFKIILLRKRIKNLEDNILNQNLNSIICLQFQKKKKTPLSIFQNFNNIFTIEKLNPPEKFAANIYLLNKLFCCSTIQKNTKLIDLNSLQLFKLLKSRITTLYFLYSIDQLKNEIIKKQIHYRKSSDYKHQLKERKKFSILYGFLPKRQIIKIYNKAHQYQGRIDYNMVLLLEKRIDIILYRISFFKNIRFARQNINHKKILINGQVVNIPSYQIKPGDIISVKCTQLEKTGSIILDNLKKNIKLRTSRFIISDSLLNRLQKLFIVSNKNIEDIQLKSKNQDKNLLESIINNKISKTSRFLKYSNKNTFSMVKALSIIKSIEKLNPSDYNYFLNLKKNLYKKRTRRQYLSALRINPMKPINIEVSYKYLTAIFLYSPQKLAFPTLIDVDKITRSITK